MKEKALMFDAALLRGREEKFIGNIGDVAVLDTVAVERLLIGVHDGMYHADEALSVALIKLAFPTKRVGVVRSRNPELLQQCDLLIDVGEGLLDHHGSRAEAGVAACTRVLQLLLQSDIPENLQEFLQEVVSPVVDTVALQDTGTAVDNHPFPWLHAMAAYDAIEFRSNGEAEAFRFMEAVDRIHEELFERFYVFNMANEAKSAAESAMAEQASCDVVVFPDSCREAELKKLLWEHKHQAIYYVSKEAENDYRVLCAAPVDQPFSYFGSKQLIPEKFRGLRGDDLSASCSIPGGIFCHAAGFISGFDTEAGAAAFAKLCVEESA